MLKRGLLSLICLGGLAAGSWAATTYQLQTKLASSGGTIAVGTSPAQYQDVLGALYTSTSQEVVPVTVTPLPGYKIVGLTKNNVSLMNNHPAYANWSTQSFTTNFYSADVASAKTKVQSLVATFKLIAPGSAGAIAPTTWQMQLKNMNQGGSITTDQSFAA